MNSSSKRPEYLALETLRELGWSIPAGLCISTAPDGSNVTRNTCFVITQSKHTSSR